MTRAVGLALVAALAVLGACGGDDDDDLSTDGAAPRDEVADAQAHAFDLGVQSELRNAMTAAKTIAVDAAGLFLDASGEPLDDEDLAAIEPTVELDLVVTDPEGANIVLVKVSESGTAFCIAATTGGVVTYGSDDDPSNVDSIADCTDGSW